MCKASAVAGRNRMALEIASQMTLFDYFWSMKFKLTFRNFKRGFHLAARPHLIQTLQPIN